MEVGIGGDSEFEEGGQRGGVEDSGSREAAECGPGEGGWRRGERGKKHGRKGEWKEGDEEEEVDDSWRKRDAERSGGSKERMKDVRRDDVDEGEDEEGGGERAGGRRIQGRPCTSLSRLALTIVRVVFWGRLCAHIDGRARVIRIRRPVAQHHTLRAKQ